VVQGVFREVAVGIDAGLIQLHHENAARSIGERGSALQIHTGQVAAPADRNFFLSNSQLQDGGFQQVVTLERSGDRIVQRDNLSKSRGCARCYQTGKQQYDKRCERVLLFTWQPLPQRDVWETESLPRDGYILIGLAGASIRRV
jgi:hypothetical protein